jgi:hypothetical protein
MTILGWGRIRKPGAHQTPDREGGRSGLIRPNGRKTRNQWAHLRV